MQRPSILTGFVGVARLTIGALALFSSAALFAQSSATPPPPPAAPSVVAEPVAPAAPPSDTQKVGDKVKRTIGKLTDIEAADGACFITFVDDKKSEWIEVGLAALCNQKPSLKNKRVFFEYKMEDMPAASCAGDPKCKKRETIPAIVSMKELP